MSTPMGSGAQEREQTSPGQASQALHAAGSAAEAAIICRGVTYTYPDGTHANNGIDLSIHEGELFCLLGPNGAGKTTLIRQITTELVPKSGSIHVLGLEAHADPMATKRRLGVIPQSAGLFEGLSVEQHLTHFGPLKHLTRRETHDAVEEVIVECELQDLRKKRTGALSGGQKRKVLVALALLSDPEILVLDEPTVGLDPVARRTLWTTIERQREAGKTILLTTHYMDEAEHLADRIAFIGNGVISRIGTLHEFHEQMGQSVRVTELDPESGTTLGQDFFDTLPEAQAFVRERGLDTYSVGRVSLEDIYLRLVGQSLDGNNGEAGS